MNKKIFTINFEVPGKNDFICSYSSRRSLMDADILIFNPDTPEGFDNYYQGKSSYSDIGSFQYKEDNQHWEKELSSFLNIGRTAFLFLKEKEYFFLNTGTKEYKPKITINHVNSHHNYEFLPISIGTITAAKGSGIEFSNHPLFSNFFKNFKNNLEYQVYLEDVGNPTVVFTGKDKTKILGAVFNVGAGHLVALPCLNYDEDKFVEYKKDKKGEEKEYWTKDAIKFGDILVACLIEIDKGLTQESIKTPPPPWVNENYSNKEETIIQNDIDKNIGEIIKIEQKNNKLQIELQKEQILKYLLYEQGKLLENAVIKALEILGFKAENFDNGDLELDQVITSPEGARYIGECEGKNEKDIDITKFRQLLESLNADFARDEVEEKAFGILFGNAQRLTEPEKRMLDFTQKCKIGAKREKIALVKTIDLFFVAKYLKENKNNKFQVACRKAINDGLGEIVKFPKIPEEKNEN